MSLFMFFSMIPTAAVSDDMDVDSQAVTPVLVMTDEREAAVRSVSLQTADGTAKGDWNLVQGVSYQVQLTFDVPSDLPERGDSNNIVTLTYDLPESLSVSGAPTVDSEAFDPVLDGRTITLSLRDGAVRPETVTVTVPVQYSDAAEGIELDFGSGLFFTADVAEILRGTYALENVKGGLLSNIKQNAKTFTAYEIRTAEDGGLWIYEPTVPLWTFEPQSDGTYYISSDSEYLNIADRNTKGEAAASLSPAPQNLTVQRSGGQIRIATLGGAALNLYANNIANGFGGWRNDNGTPEANDWFILHPVSDFSDEPIRGVTAGDWLIFNDRKGYAALLSPKALPNNGAKLSATEVEVRTDGLWPKDSAGTVWTFTHKVRNWYTIQTGGQYLNISSSGLSLSGTEQLLYVENYNNDFVNISSGYKTDSRSLDRSEKLVDGFKAWNARNTLSSNDVGQRMILRPASDLAPDSQLLANGDYLIYSPLDKTAVMEAEQDGAKLKSGSARMVDGAIWPESRVYSVWTIEHAGRDWYYIQNKRSGQYLHIASSGLSLSGEKQEIYVTRNGDGSWNLSTGSLGTQYAVGRVNGNAFGGFRSVSRNLNETQQKLILQPAAEFGPGFISNGSYLFYNGQTRTLLTNQADNGRIRPAAASLSEEGKIRPEEENCSGSVWTLTHVERDWYTIQDQDGLYMSVGSTGVTFTEERTEVFLQPAADGYLIGSGPGTTDYVIRKPDNNVWQNYNVSANNNAGDSYRIFRIVPAGDVDDTLSLNEGTYYIANEWSMSLLVGEALGNDARRLQAAPYSMANGTPHAEGKASRWVFQSCGRDWYTVQLEGTNQYLNLQADRVTLGSEQHLYIQQMSNGTWMFSDAPRHGKDPAYSVSQKNKMLQEGFEKANLKFSMESEQMRLYPADEMDVSERFTPTSPSAILSVSSGAALMQEKRSNDRLKAWSTISYEDGTVSATTTGDMLTEWFFDKVTDLSGDWYYIHTMDGQYLNINRYNVSTSTNPQPLFLQMNADGNIRITDGTAFGLRNLNGNVNEGFKGDTTKGADEWLTLKPAKQMTGIWLTLDKAGGNATEPMLPTRHAEGEEVRLPSAEELGLTRSGYSFIGWTDTANLKGDKKYHLVYKPGEIYTMPAKGTTLYAAWSGENYDKATFFIRLDGTFPDEPGNFSSSDYSGRNVAAVYNETVKEWRWVVDCDTTKPVEGNHISNYVTDNLNILPTDAELQRMAPGFDPANQFVLWYVVKWENDGSWHVDGVILDKEKVTIAYKQNAPEGYVQNMPVGYQVLPGTEVPVGSDGKPNGKVKTPSRTGYIFMGWDTKEDGSGKRYNGNDLLTLNDNVTLYAIWSNGSNLLRVSKVNDRQTPLADAKFTLEAKQADGRFVTMSSALTTGKDGVFAYQDVKNDTIYRLTETFAPDGYEKQNSFCFTVTVDPGNKDILGVHVCDEDGNDQTAPDWLKIVYTSAENSGAEGVLDISFAIRDERTVRQITLQRVDENGKPLENVTYTLDNTEGDSFSNLLKASGADGVFSVNGASIPYGTYSLTETNRGENPRYKQNDIRFTLGSYRNGENTGLTVTGGDAEGSCAVSSREEGGLTITTYAYTLVVKSELQPYAYTVHHYLKGTTTRVREDETGKAVYGSTVTAAPAETCQGLHLTVDSYLPSRTVTISGSENEMTVYYTLPLALAAKTDSKTYDGQPLTGAYTVTGALPGDETAVRNALGTAPSITNAGAVDYLTEEDQAGITGIPEYYAVTWEPGKLTIDPAAVTVTAETKSKKYGDADPTLTAKVTGLKNGDRDSVISYTLSRAEGEDVRNGGYAITAAGEAAQGNYTVTYANAALTISPRQVILTSGTDEKEYDGNPLTNDDMTVSGDGFAEDEGADYLFTGSQTLAGASENTFTYELKEGTQPGNYEITVHYGTLTVFNRDALYEITVTANSLNAGEYDGTEKSVSGLTADTFTVDGNTYTVTGLTAEAKGTGAGEYVSAVTGTPKVTDSEGNDVTDQFRVHTQNGLLTIERKPVTVTAENRNKTYGDSDPALTWTATGLVNGESEDLLAVSMSRESGENAGTYAITPAGDAEQGNYDVTYVPANLTIGKRTVILTSGTDEKEYDGNPLTNDDMIVSGDGFAEDEGADYLFTGSQTLAGASENTFTYELKEGTQPGNYEITVHYGTLTVFNRDALYEITVTANSLNAGEYDGTEKSVSGLTADTFTVDGNTYTVTGLTAEAKGTGAGEYVSAVTGTPKVTDSEGNDVTDQFRVHTQNGLLTIERKPVTVTAENRNKTYGDSDPALTWTVSGLVNGESEDLLTVSMSRESGENAGTYPITAAGDAEQGNYLVTYVPGVFTIEAAAVEEPAIPTYSLIIHYLADGQSVVADFHRTYPGGAAYNVTSPAVKGYNADQAAVSGTITENLELEVHYTRQDAVLTIRYLTLDGTKLAEDQVVAMKYGDTYRYTVPAFENYEAQTAAVEGTMTSASREVIVWYLPTPEINPGENGTQSRIHVNGTNYIMINDMMTPLGLGEIFRGSGESVE